MTSPPPILTIYAVGRRKDRNRSTELMEDDISLFSEKEDARAVASPMFRAQENGPTEHYVTTFLVTRWAIMWNGSLRFMRSLPNDGFEWVEHPNNLNPIPKLDEKDLLKFQAVVKLTPEERVALGLPEQLVYPWEK